MSDNIPFEIQMGIIEKVYDVKSLIQFRSVSKPWKSFIDSSDFIKSYGARHTQPHRHILSLSLGSEYKFICLVEDDNNETLKVQQQELAPFVVSPLLKQYLVLKVVGACHGLLCLYGYNKDSDIRMLVIWNPSIGKSFGIGLPSFNSKNPPVFGFGVCPVTRDPTIVKIIYAVNMPWRVEVFTLSLRVWNVIPSGNLPRQSIRLDKSTQVVIHRFIYWGACEETCTDLIRTNRMVVSFDLITKVFEVVNLPDSLTNKLFLRGSSVSKLRGSLIVSGYILSMGGLHFGVWVMEHDLSFRKLFAIGEPLHKVLGFRKNGETIFETRKEAGRFTTLDVYNPCSQQYKNLGISGVEGTFFMGSYKESLLLLDQVDSHIPYDNN
uniref:F-box domain-containing protein n=1 Tax=Tanacetum cinerariifolium TaxID=118510 RepID=A0A6L2LVE8_TANCI|nr:hypothetical protein [Tanacetum cinerariifolium]